MPDGTITCKSKNIIIRGISLECAERGVYLVDGTLLEIDRKTGKLKLTPPKPSRE